MDERQRTNCEPETYECFPDVDDIELVPCTCLSIPCCCDLENPDATYNLSVGEEFRIMREKHRIRREAAKKAGINLDQQDSITGS